jgi:hypothetical protein
MTFKEQLKKIKDNWLIAVILIVLVVMMSGGNNVLTEITRQYAGGTASYDLAAGESYSKAGVYYPAPSMDGDFAPDVLERKIVKTASITNEVKRGQFKESEAKLKSIIKASDSYLLNENVNKYGN